MKTFPTVEFPIMQAKTGILKACTLVSTNGTEVDDNYEGNMESLSGPRHVPSAPHTTEFLACPSDFLWSNWAACVRLWRRKSSAIIREQI